MSEVPAAASLKTEAGAGALKRLVTTSGAAKGQPALFAAFHMGAFGYAEALGENVTTLRSDALCLPDP